MTIKLGENDAVTAALKVVRAITGLDAIERYTLGRKPVGAVPPDKFWCDELGAWLGVEEILERFATNDEWLALSFRRGSRANFWVASIPRGPEMQFWVIQCRLEYGDAIPLSVRVDDAFGLMVAVHRAAELVTDLPD